MHADQHEYSQIMVWSHLAQNLYLNQLQASLRRACLFSNFEKMQALRSDACIKFKVCDEIFQRQFPNFNSKWIGNFVHYFKWHLFASTSWCPVLIVITINQGNNFFFRSLKLQWFTLSILIWSRFECFEESIRCRYLPFFSNIAQMFIILLFVVVWRIYWFKYFFLAEISNENFKFWVLALLVTL